MPIIYLSFRAIFLKSWVSYEICRKLRTASRSNDRHFSFISIYVNPIGKKTLRKTLTTSELMTVFICRIWNGWNWNCVQFSLNATNVTFSMAIRFIESCRGEKAKKVPQSEIGSEFELLFGIEWSFCKIMAFSWIGLEISILGVSLNQLISIVNISLATQTTTTMPNFTSAVVSLMRFVVKTFVCEWMCMLFNQYRRFFPRSFSTNRILISIAIVHVLNGLKTSVPCINLISQYIWPTRN